jgi:hypothetical protein
MNFAKTCALCGSQLSNKNRSKEHVIPNSIGGRLKTADFICKSCNSTYGGSWDSELAKQLNWFSHALAISRETGEPPRELVTTVEGEKYWLHADGSLYPEKSSSYSEEASADGLRISLTAKSVEEAVQRLKGVARKHPKFDVKKAIADLEVKTQYLDSPLHFTIGFGGSEAGRSLVKTAFAFASVCGVDHKQCEQAYRYLSEATYDPPFGHAYLSDPVQDRSNETLLHCVTLQGDPTTSRLWSYIEYFGLFRVVVLLSSKYSGPKMTESHAINPIDGAIIPGKLRVKFEGSELDEILGGKGWSREGYVAAADYAMPKILARNRQRGLERVIEEGFHHAAKSLGIAQDEFIPREQAELFTRLMMDKVGPYLSSLLRSPRSI